MFGKIKDGVKNAVLFIIRLVKFIPTVLGQICFWVAIVILAVVLLYLIINILANAIAGILGLDGVGLEGSSDYELLSKLTSSGYDVVMPADELQDYYAYEYAVLMDLARNIEEAGTYMPVLIDKADFDPSLIDVNEWAKLCAASFVTKDITLQHPPTAAANYKKINDAIAAANINKNSDRATIRQAVATAIAGSGVSVTNQVGLQDYIDFVTDQIMAEAEGAKPSNEKSKSELIYKSVTSDTTGETSLVPFLVVFRPVKIYTYRFIDESMLIGPNGENSKDYSGIFRQGKGRGYPGNVSYNITNSTATGPTWKYIADYIKPLRANTTLNANNISLYKKDAPGSSGNIDLTATYSEGVFVAEKDHASVTYEIPVKVLADRFMPKAVLLSSWYMLKQDETNGDESSKAVDLILKEIRKIYDKACLENETRPIQNWLLVKDVKKVEKTTEAEIKMKKLLTRGDFSSLNVLDTYTFKVDRNNNPVETDLIYEKYNTKYDSRILTPPVPTTTPTQPTSTQQSLLEPYEQVFSTDANALKKDIVDDFELTLSHHNKEIYGFMNKKQYDTAVADLNRVLAPVPNDDLLKEIETLSTVEEYILYKTDTNGKYIIDCELMKGDTCEHHTKIYPSGSHLQKYGHEENTPECEAYALNETQYHSDPYANNSRHAKCFIEQIKLSTGRVNITPRKVTDNSVTPPVTTEHEVSVKVTGIVVIEGNIKYLYRVDEKDIEDLAGLSNLYSFMKFDRYDAQMSNIGDWDEVNSSDDAKERTFFIVTDAFEAWPVNFEKSIDLDLNRNGYYTARYKNSQGIWETWSDAPNSARSGVKQRIKSDILEEIDNIDMSAMIDAAIAANGNKITFYTGGLGVKKDQKDADGNFTDEALTPPKNAAPVASSGMLPAYYDDKTGESDVITGTYINMKGVDPADVAAVMSYINREMRLEIERIIESYCRTHHVTWTHVDPDGTVGETKSVTTFAYTTPTFASVDKANKAVIYPVTMRISTIRQTVKQRQIPMYLPRYANTWSSEKRMSNRLEIMGEFDPTCSEASGGYFQLIPRTNVGGGLSRIEVNISRQWRADFYAKHFSKVRESDVLAMMAEWEKSGANGHFAAYTYMRDIYVLLQRSKLVKDVNGLPYVHEDSYTYMYIPDEILFFDESVTDKAYWFERLLATPGEDSIKKEENYTMRNKRSVKTWQIVDYEKYEECKDPSPNASGDPVYNVYALWPLGGYLGRSVYAFEANASTSGNKKILSWGSYVGPGVHSGCDFYGRSSAAQIYNSVFSSGEPTITSEYNVDGTVTLKSASGSATLGVSDTGVDVESSDPTVSSGGGRVDNSKPIKINIEGKEVTFNGTASAVYGYELYRLTKAYKSGEKAAEELKDTLKKEMKDTPLVAIAPGIVEDVSGGFRPGFKATIKHVGGDQVRSAYVHMKRWPEVQVGEYVGAGTIIGYEGTTGNSGGNHIHFEMTVNGQGARYPIPYLYPFFTPFYYEEKAAENEYKLESEYMSLIRTVFPYGELTEDAYGSLNYIKPSSQTGVVEQVEIEDNKIIIKNYVPSLKMCTSGELYTAKDVDEEQKLHEEIFGTEKNPKPASDNIGGVTYNGENLIALPQYFDREFMSEVARNGGHILVSQP